MTTLLTLLLAGVVAGLPAQGGRVKVVTSLTTYAAITREITGDRAAVSSMAEGDEDPHFVQPRPSFVPLLRDADLFVTTGMDLELWVPALLDRAGNARVREGSPGYVSAYEGISLMEVPADLSRSQGDIHVHGNPHIHTDPINAILIARNVLAGLVRVSPANAAYFTERERDFELRVLRATYGDELVPRPPAVLGARGRLWGGRARGPRAGAGVSPPPAPPPLSALGPGERKGTSWSP